MACGSRAASYYYLASAGCGTSIQQRPLQGSRQETLPAPASDQVLQHGCFDSQKPSNPGSRLEGSLCTSRPGSSATYRFFLPATPAVTASDPELQESAQGLRDERDVFQAVYLNVRAGFKVAVCVCPSEITETTHVNGLTIEVVHYGRYQTATE